MADLGRLLHLTGDLPGAVDALTRALKINRELGHRSNEAVSLTGLGRLLHLTGDLPGAVDALTQALACQRTRQTPRWRSERGGEPRSSSMSWGFLVVRVWWWPGWGSQRMVDAVRWEVCGAVGDCSAGVS